MAKIYLDTNLLIDVFDSRDEDLHSLLFLSAENGAHQFPFTSTQIEEVPSHKLDDRTYARLAELSTISRDLYLYSAPNVFEWQTTSPTAVWETVAPHQGGDVDLDFSNFIPYSSVKGMREELGLDLNKLNNMSGEDAVAEIDKAFTKQHDLKFPDGPSSLKELMASFEVALPTLLKGVYDAAGQIDRSFGISDRVMMALVMLELFGYWPDSKGLYAKGSRFPDGKPV